MKKEHTSNTFFFLSNNITMSSRFLSSDSTANLAALQDGTFELSVASAFVSELTPSLPVKTNADKKLISGLINLNDINATLLTNPYVGTLEATALKTASIENQISSTRIDMTSATDIDFQATNLTFNGQPIGGITDPVEKLDYSRATPYNGPTDQTNKYSITAPILQTDNIYQCAYYGQNDLGVETPGALIQVRAGSNWTDANSNAQTEIAFAVANLNTGFTGSPTLVIRDTVDLYRDIDMRNNNIVDIGGLGFNLVNSLINTETSIQNLTTSVADLGDKTQNITAIAGVTTINGGVNQKLGVTDSFIISDDGSPLSVLKFKVNNTDICSQIKHIFSSGLEPALNSIGSLGTALKRFSGLWVDNINGLTPVGGLYSGLSDGALVQGGFLGSLLPGTGTPVNGLTVPANGFEVGDSFHLVCAGDIPVGDKDDVITITLNQNGAQLAQLSVDMEDSTNTFFELEADFQVRSKGVTGQIITNFDFTFNKQLLKDFKGSRHVQLSTIDTTTASTLTLTAQFAGQFNSTLRTRLFYLRKQF
jgi:hypothetical protein